MMTIGTVQPHRQMRWEAFLLAFSLVILLHNTCESVAETTITPEVSQKGNITATDVIVRFVDNRLSVKAENAEIKSLLAQIGLKSGFAMMVDQTIEGKVSIAFDDLPLEEGLNKILEALGDKNVAIEYEKSPGGKEQERILQVILLRGAKKIYGKSADGGEKTALQEKDGNVVEYHDGRLTVVVTDMDAMELFSRIEQTVSATSRPMSIETAGPIEARITMKMRNAGMSRGLDAVAMSLGSSKYKTEFIVHTKIARFPGQPMGTIYRILRRSPNEEREYFEKLNGHKASGLALYRRGNLAGAEKQFADALWMDPSYGEGKLYIGRIYVQRKEFDTGIEYLQDALRMDPTLVEAEYDLGMAYRENGYLDDALKHLKAYAEKGQDAKRVEEAKKIIGDYESTTKKAFLGRIKEAREYQNKGEHQKAEKAYRDLIQDFPDERDPYQYLAEVYWRSGRAQDSIKLLEPLMERNPRDSRYLMALAKTYLSMNDFEKAKEYANKVIELNENSELAGVAKAWIREIEKQQPRREDKGDRR